MNKMMKCKVVDSRENIIGSLGCSADFCQEPRFREPLKTRPDPHFGAKVRKTSSKTSPNGSPGRQKQHFSAFLEFLISMPLSAIIAVFACPGAPNSFQDAAKRQLVTGCRKARPRNGSFAIHSRKCLKMGSPAGSRGAPRTTF